MSYKNKVFQKLFETKEVELSQEGVNLNMMKEFLSLLKDAESNRDKVLKGLPNVTPLIKMATDARRDFVLVQDEAKKLEKAFNELGLNPDAKVSNAVKVGLSAAKEMDKIANALKPLSNL